MKNNDFKSMRNTPCNIYSSFKARNSSTSSVWYLGIWVVLDVDSLVVVVVVVVGSLIFAVDVGPNVVLSSRLEIEKSGLLVLVVIPGISFGYCSVVVIGVVDVGIDSGFSVGIVVTGEVTGEGILVAAFVFWSSCRFELWSKSEWPSSQDEVFVTSRTSI